MKDAFGHVLRKYDVVVVGNRSRFGVYVIVDDAPTPSGFARAVWSDVQFDHYDENGKIVRTARIVPTILKDFESSVKLFTWESAEISALVKEARRVYGPRDDAGN